MTRSPAAPHGRRFSLRARLIALVLAVAAAALVAVDIVIPVTTRSTLIAGKDRSLTSVVDSLPSRMVLDQALAQVSQQNPLAGDIGWSQVTLSGTAKVLRAPAGFPNANPAVGARPSTTAPVSVGDAGGGNQTYRILGAANLRDQMTGAPAGYVVAWIPLADVDTTIRRLVILEILISLGLLVLVGGSAGLVIRRELRPLETMARTADSIAAGDLSRRVEPGDPGTEVGRLGTAFNGMVDSVSELLTERAESERRMRQFVADASHELRTPVAAIRGYTDLYGAGALGEDSSVTRAMERMGFESRRMGSLVEDLLTLTHSDADTEVPDERVDLALLLTGVVDDAAVIDSTRVWRLAGTGSGAIVLGDRLRLHQLFANLLANVRTHTPAGTTATVSISTAPSLVAVAVVDDGPGVSDESLPRLFDRFFREDKARSRERGGSGLGLSIAASIVRAHRGRIFASRTVGGGLTLTVVLPAAPEPTASDQGPQGDRQRPAGPNDSAVPGEVTGTDAHPDNSAVPGESAHPAGAAAANPADPADPADPAETAVTADSPDRSGAERP